MMNDRAAIDGFLDMLAVERAAAVNTLAAYRRDLEGFSASCAMPLMTVRQ